MDAPAKPTNTVLDYQPQSTTKIVSEGQRLLRMIQISDTEMGKILKIGRITINGWRTGRCKPGLENRKQLRQNFNIQIEAWDMVPQSKEPIIRDHHGKVVVPRNAPAQKPVPPPEMMGADAPSEGILPPAPMTEMLELPIRKLAEFGSKHSEPLPDTRDGIEQLLRSLRSARNNQEILPTDRVKLATAETRAYAILQKIDKESEMAEDRIIRQHPKWQKMRSAMIGALKPFPDAMRAVVNALKELEMVE